jgi:hypothetical protein
VDAKNRNVAALAAFLDASSRVGQSFKDAAKARAEMVGLILDIGMGFLVPGLGKGLGKLVNDLPVNSPDIAYQFALRLQDADFAKGLVTGITKASISTMKANSAVLFGDMELDAFLLKWKVITEQGFQTAREGLDAASDDAVVAFWAAFDAANVNSETYTAEIKDICQRFQAQVESQGTRPMQIEHGQVNVLRNTVFIIHGLSEGARLGLVDQFNNHFGGWVDHLFRDMAVDRTRQLVGRLPTIDASAIVDLTRDNAQSAAVPPMNGTWRTNGTNGGTLFIESERGSHVKGRWESDPVGGSYTGGDFQGTRTADTVVGRWDYPNEEEPLAGGFSITLDHTQSAFTGTYTVNGDSAVYPYNGNQVSQA